MAEDPDPPRTPLVGLPTSTPARIPTGLRSGERDTPMNPRSNALWTFVVTAIALLMVILDNLVVTTALPVIQQ